MVIDQLAKSKYRGPTFKMRLHKGIDLTNDQPPPTHPDGCRCIRDVTQEEEGYRIRILRHRWPPLQCAPNGVPNSKSSKRGRLAQNRLAYAQAHVRFASSHARGAAHCGRPLLRAL